MQRRVGAGETADYSLRDSATLRGASDRKKLVAARATIRPDSITGGLDVTRLRSSVRATTLLFSAALLYLTHMAAMAQTTASAPDAAAPVPQILEVQGGHIRVVTLASGLSHPWSLAFLPDGKTLLVAEAGRLRVIRGGVLDPEPAWTVPAGTSPQNNDTMKWIALHPDFAKNKRVYVSYPLSGERGTTLAVGYGTFDGKKLSGFKQIFAADAWETGGNMGGKLLFGPDATLYVTVGDRDTKCCQPTDDNSLRLKAQASRTTSARRFVSATTAASRKTIRSSAAPTRSRRSSRTAIATATASRSIPTPDSSGKPRSARWAATR